MGAIVLDAVVVGAGPNGLAAAWTLASAGLGVHIFERDAVLGGGCRTETWGNGYRADWGSAVHPMAIASPFLKLAEAEKRLTFITPSASYAHPLEKGAAIAWNSLERTAQELGADGGSWTKLVRPLAGRVSDVVNASLSSIPVLASQPIVASRLAYAAVLARFGAGLRTEGGRALLSGVIAHSVGRQPQLGTAAPGVVLAALAHTVGWPIPVGGAQSITDLLHEDLERWGATFTMNAHIEALESLPPARCYFFDTSARSMMQIAASRVRARYRRALSRMAPGNAVSKVDLVLDRPISWAAPDVSLAGTVHLCGNAEDVRRAEAEVASGRHSARPMIVLSQPSTFDPSRAPDGLQSVWAYAHVPTGSDLPQTEVVIRAIERFAPGFRDTIVDSRATTAAQIYRRNPTMVGGDFASGAITTRQLLARPRMTSAPWLAGNGLYLCSTAVTPGPGVHGMGGYGAARHALKTVFR